MSKNPRQVSEGSAKIHNGTQKIILNVLQNPMAIDLAFTGIFL